MSASRRLPRRLLAEVRRSLDTVARRALGLPYWGARGSPFRDHHDLLGRWLHGEEVPSREKLCAELVDLKEALVLGAKMMQVAVYRDDVLGTVQKIDRFIGGRDAE